MSGVGLLLAALLAVACDMPTELPRLQTRFVIPGEQSSIAVAALLPADVRVEGAQFRVLLGAHELGPRRLADMCGAPCTQFHGQQVPKPAFTDSMTVALPLPADVAGGTLAGGTVTVELVHDLGFDLLRQSGRAQDGSLTLTVRSGARVLGSVTVRDPFPSGVPLRQTIPLQPGDISGELSATVRLESPAGGTGAGDRVHVDATASIRGTITPDPVLVSAARVRVAGRAVAVQDVTIDVRDVDADLSDRVRGGALVVRLSNPFAVAGSLQLRLTGPGFDLTRPLAVQPGATQQRVEFSEQEMRSLLGRVINMRASGLLNGQVDPVELAPDQVLGVTTRLELLLEIGA